MKETRHGENGTEGEEPEVRRVEMTIHREFKEDNIFFLELKWNVKRTRSLDIKGNGRIFVKNFIARCYLLR